MTEGWTKRKATGLLVLADGTVIEGFGLGAAGVIEGEVCFNTALTGYQEILTDPSYARQIVTFTFPHIGNVGANEEDQEDLPVKGAGAVGAIFRAEISEPSNYRSSGHLDAWLKARGAVAQERLVERCFSDVMAEVGDATSIDRSTAMASVDTNKRRATEAARRSPTS